MQQGFSLLETLVVVCIVGIVSAAASVALVSGNAARQLGHDAQRLAQLFALAQADARAWGQPVVWQYTSRGYRFQRLSAREPLSRGNPLRAAADPVSLYDQGALRPRPWSLEAAVRVTVTPPDATMFTGDWLSGPAYVQLTDGRHAIHIQRTAAGVYKVQP